MSGVYNLVNYAREDYIEKKDIFLRFVLSLTYSENSDAIGEREIISI